MICVVDTRRVETSERLDRNRVGMDWLHRRFHPPRGKHGVQWVGYNRRDLCFDSRIMTEVH